MVNAVTWLYVYYIILSVVADGALWFLLQVLHTHSGVLQTYK